MRILTLVVDLGVVRICESNNIGTIQENRYNKLNTKVLSCVKATFFSDFFDTVNLNDVDAVFIFITNEKYLQSYSHNLIDEILKPKRFYKLVGGNSVKTSNANLDCMKYMLYCRDEKLQHFKVSRKFNHSVKKLTKGKYGIIGLSFKATFGGSVNNYNIVCFCLPHDNKNENYNITRSEKTLIIHNAVNKIMNKNTIENENLILLGDFGYLLDVNKNEISNMTLNDMYNKDVLLQELSKHKYLEQNGFKEGINGDGLNFFPTFKISSRCNDEIIQGNNSEEYLNLCLREHDSEVGWPIRTLFNQFASIDEQRVVTYGNIKELNNLGMYSIANV